LSRITPVGAPPTDPTTIGAALAAPAVAIVTNTVAASPTIVDFFITLLHYRGVTPPAAIYVSKIGAILCSAFNVRQFAESRAIA
jgi:hypothetical protein